jgi:hypothetical protein
VPLGSSFSILHFQFSIRFPPVLLALDRFRWSSTDDGAYWSFPPGAIGGLDLRPLPDCIPAGTYGERPWSLFAYREDATLDGEAFELGRGDAREYQPDAAAKDAWRSLIGYRPQGETLAEWIADQLTFGSDPAGWDRPAPLMPGVDGWLRIDLPGHKGPIFRRKHRWGDSFTERIAARLHADYRALEIANREHVRRCLDYWAEKYRLTQGDEWRVLLPPEIRDSHPGRLPHQTSFTESWPTDSSTLSTGQDQPWTEVLNDSEVTGGRIAGVTGNTEKRNRCETALSGADHYCQAAITHIAAGSTARSVRVDARYDAGADTSYSYRVRGNSGGESIEKCVAGTFTVLASGARANSLDTIYLEASGSNLLAKYAGSLALSTTDTSITAGVRIGCGGNGAGATWGLDSIVAEDLAVASGQPTMRRWGGVPGMRIGGHSFGRNW